MSDPVFSLIQASQQKNEPEASARAELDWIIANEQVITLFQPIFDTSTYEPFAYEALTRGPKDSLLHMPQALFEAAAQYNRVAELDCLCRKKAIENFSLLGLPGKLSLNICPSSLIDPNFESGRTMRVLHKVGLPIERVILELTEQQSVDHAKLKVAAQYYQNMGFSIALDDLGAGYSSLRLLAELKPKYIKIDKFFVSGVHANEVAGDFIGLIQELATRVDCKVVAEGIESTEELHFIVQSGIAFGQGYLLGMPSMHPNTGLPSALLESVKLAATAHASTVYLNAWERVSSLASDPTEPCMDSDPASAMLTRFQQNPVLLAIPVLCKTNVVGVLLRDEILNTFSTPYAHSLYHHATAQTMMQSAPLTIQLTDSLTHVSQLATRRSLDQVYCPLIVCDGETYVGMLSIRELLKSITDMQLEHALHCNPLSRLPGNIRIESEVQARLDAKIPFVLLHFDLDNFKAYNDYYGYERGDKMILLVSDLLRKTVISNDFVGHIGGDDFVMLVVGVDWEDRIWAMLDNFSKESALLYDVLERKQKHIETTDRAGDIQCFDLASLSVSALPCAPGKFSSHLQASEVIAEIKHRSKKIKGNSLVVNRRED